MRDGETEYGRDEGDRTCGAEDLPAGARPWAPLTRNSGGGRIGNGRHRIACRAQTDRNGACLCPLSPAYTRVMSDAQENPGVRG